MPKEQIQKREEKLWTSTYPNNSKAQLDYIFINKKWINSTLNSEVYSSFEGAFFHHRISSAKICLSLRRNKKLDDWSSLANSDVSNQYTVSERNKFDTLQETSERHTPNKE